MSVHSVPSVPALHATIHVAADADPAVNVRMTPDGPMTSVEFGILRMFADSYPAPGTTPVELAAVLERAAAKIRAAYAELAEAHDLPIPAPTPLEAVLEAVLAAVDRFEADYTAADAEAGDEDTDRTAVLEELLSAAERLLDECRVVAR